MANINATELTLELLALRNEGNRDRENCRVKVLHCLKYADDKSVSIPGLNAFLIRVTSERFGISANRDIVLMAFGLLKGYHYEEINEIENRRDKYLTDSNHQQTRARKKEPYVGASDKRKKALRGNLRKMEDGLIESLAYHIAKQAKNADENADEEGGIEKYVKSRISPIAIPQPSYILLAHEPKSAPADDDDGALFPDTPPLDDENAAPDGEALDSEETSEQNELEEGLSAYEPKSPLQQPDTPPEKDPPPGESEVPLSTPPPNPQRTHTWQFSIGSIININKKSQVNANLSWVKNSIFSIVVIIGAVMACVKLFHPSAPPTDNISSAQTIVVVNGDILLAPNNLFGLNAAVLPAEDANTTLRYVSSDPSIVAVGEHNGMLQATASHPAGGLQTADITITDGSGATTTKTVTVDFDLPNNNSTYDTPDNSGPGHNIFPDSNSGPGHSIQLDDFVPEFTINQKIRVAGDTEWHNYVDAKVGDELEIQVEYQNTSENEHVNVAVRDILPTYLEFISGSTTIYTTQTPTGLKKEDGIVGNGIYIGTYGSNSNAYVRFRVRVVDVNLADEVTGLVNWSQACVNGVTLQDYATVRVTK